MGIAKPADMGVDVMQFNLHKTFSTPHGGGGPGAGPVAVRAPLVDYLPVPRLVRRDGALAWTEDAPKSVGRLRAFYGNFGILVRAHAYLARLGGPGLAEATRLAVLNANYLRARLAGPTTSRTRRLRCTSASSPTATSRTTTSTRSTSPSASSTTASTRPPSTSRWW